MDTYWSASILPSTSVTLPTPFQPIQPHTMMFPPSNVTVPWTSLSINLSTTCFHINYSPYDPILLTLVSPDQIALFQPSTEHWLCLRAKAYYFPPVHMAFLLCHSLKQLLLKHSSGCLWVEWMGVDDANKFGDLNSISSLPSGDLGEDR